MFLRWVGLAVVLATWTVRASAIEATLVADAHVNAARPMANSGAISNLNVGGDYTALMQFDLGNLPSGTTASQVSRAVLRLYCNRADVPGTINLQAVNAAWGEYSVTYASLPAMAGASLTFAVSRNEAYVSVDITSLVQSWITNPTSNNGIALTAATASVQFDSKENDLTGHAPQLEVALVSQGPKGDTGAAGIQGPAGPLGPIGPIGPQGIPGPVGPAGSQGLKGDPGSVGPIGPVGPQGATGMPGVQGPAGPAGTMGLQGPKGDAGPTGATGPQGGKGSPGLVYRGGYGATINYSSGDVVFWDGASFVSLLDDNYGNVPAIGSVWWGALAAHGAAGPQGPTGTQGPQGMAGPIGPEGPAGAMGAEGPTGTQGPQGMVGVAGPEGPIGPQGPSGSAGATGATGAAGPQGPAGQAGPTGPTGPMGPVGMTFRGTYSPSLTYAAGDGVSYDGAGYVSLVDSNLGNTPDQTPAAWGKFAAGTSGPAGPQGIQGIAGQAGAPGPVGATGPAGNVGPLGPQGIQGIAGAPGPQGPAGPAGVSFKGAWSSATGYVPNDAVFYEGSTYLAVATSLAARPDTTPAAWSVLAQAGSAGATGPVGAAATVSIGAVTTAPAGTPAMVTNSGSATAAVLNFTIPQGPAGASGGGAGGSGSGWGSFASVYHPVAFETYYSVSSAVSNASETSAILTWVPSGCTATTLTAYSQQTNTIKITLRVGMPGSMNATDLACTVSLNSTCTATANVVVPAGSFVDFKIEGGNGTQTAVWTALACS